MTVCPRLLNAHALPCKRGWSSLHLRTRRMLVYTVRLTSMQQHACIYIVWWLLQEITGINSLYYNAYIDITTMTESSNSVATCHCCLVTLKYKCCIYANCTSFRNNYNSPTLRIFEHRCIAIYIPCMDSLDSRRLHV